jgi:purine-binding chemotaxis protein CheW
MLPGILNQRGQILPVVELSPLLGLERAPLSRATRLVMVSHTDIDMALLVEQVLDLTSLPVGEIEPLPTALDPARARYLRGIAQHDERPVAILELSEVIAGLRA